MERFLSLFLALIFLSPPITSAQMESEDITPEEQCRSQLRADPFEVRGAILSIYRRCLLQNTQLQQQEKEGALRTQKRESLRSKGLTSFPARGALGQEARERQRQDQLKLDRRFQRVYRLDLRTFNLLQQNRVRDTRNVGRIRATTTEYLKTDYQNAARSCNVFAGLLQNICIRKELRGGTELKTFGKNTK